MRRLMSNPLPLLSACLIACVLTACASGGRVPEATDEAPPVRADTPVTGDAALPVDAEPAPGGVDGIDVLPPDGQLQARAERRRTLAARTAGVPSGADAGYTMDVLQARLQQIGGDTLGMRRDGERIVLSLPNRTSFAVGEARLDPSAATQLAPIAAVLADFSMFLVAVLGHTDDTGPVALNQRLSEQRALAVARLLVDAGVARQRVVVVGFGPSQPVATNETPEGREQNRRVELELELLSQ